MKIENSRISKYQKKNLQSSQEERQIPLLPLCKTSHKQIKTSKMIRNNLKILKLQNIKIKNLQSSQDKRQIPLLPLCKT
jgi:hypothetical protein